jgi:hypothetical protein
MSIEQEKVFAVFNKSFNRQNDIMDKLLELLDKNGGLSRLDTISAKLEPVISLVCEVKELSGYITHLRAVVDDLTKQLANSNNKVDELMKTITMLNDKVNELSKKNDEYNGEYLQEKSVDITKFKLIPRMAYCIYQQKLFYVVDFDSEHINKVVKYFNLGFGEYNSSWTYKDINTYCGSEFAISQEEYDKHIKSLNLAIGLPKPLNVLNYARHNMKSIQMNGNKYYVTIQDDANEFMIAGLKKYELCEEILENDTIVMTKEQYMKFITQY